MSETLLRDIKHPSHRQDRVCDWKYVEIIPERVRLYYKPNDNGEGYGFDFYAVEWTSGSGETTVILNPDYTTVDCLYHGTAYFDGIRHMYLGDDDTDNYGYHYYPDLDVHIALLKELKNLEIKYCRKS